MENPREVPGRGGPAGAQPAGPSGSEPGRDRRRPGRDGGTPKIYYK